MTDSRKKLIILMLALFPFFASAGGKKDVPSQETPAEYAERMLSENEGAAYPRDPIDGEHSSFDEVWGFALQERGEEIDLDAPLTDIALFTATLCPADRLFHRLQAACILPLHATAARSFISCWIKILVFEKDLKLLLRKRRRILTVFASIWSIFPRATGKIF